MNGNLSPRNINENFIWKKRPKTKTMLKTTKNENGTNKMLLKFMNETYSNDTNIQHWQIVAEKKRQGAVQ